MEYVEAFLELSKVIADVNDGWKPSESNEGWYVIFCSNGKSFKCLTIESVRKNYFFIPSCLIIKSLKIAQKIVKTNSNLYEIVLNPFHYQGEDAFAYM